MRKKIVLGVTLCSLLGIYFTRDKGQEGHANIQDSFKKIKKVEAKEKSVERLEKRGLSLKNEKVLIYAEVQELGKRLDEKTESLKKITDEINKFKSKSGAPQNLLEEYEKAKKETLVLHNQYLKDTAKTLIALSEKWRNQ